MLAAAAVGTLWTRLGWDQLIEVLVILATGVLLKVYTFVCRPVRHGFRLKCMESASIAAMRLWFASLPAAVIDVKDLQAWRANLEDVLPESMWTSVAFPHCLLLYLIQLLTLLVTSALLPIPHTIADTGSQLAAALVAICQGVQQHCSPLIQDPFSNDPANYGGAEAAHQGQRTQALAALGDSMHNSMCVVGSLLPVPLTPLGPLPPEMLLSALLIWSLLYFGWFCPSYVNMLIMFRRRHACVTPFGFIQSKPGVDVVGLKTCLAGSKQAKGNVGQSRMLGGCALTSLKASPGSPLLDRDCGKHSEVGIFSSGTRQCAGILKKELGDACCPPGGSAVGVGGPAEVAANLEFERAETRHHVSEFFCDVGSSWWVHAWFAACLLPISWVVCCQVASMMTYELQISRLPGV